MDIRANGVLYRDWMFRKYDPKSMNFIKWLHAFEYIFEVSNAEDDEKVLDSKASRFPDEEIVNFYYAFRYQLPYESIEHYVLGLRKLYSKCTPFFKNIFDIKHQFIDGLSNEETKCLLNKKKNITLSMAVCIAKQMDLAKNKKSGESSSNKTISYKY
ncbi:PREDICTED: uncharacterized protein LOC106790122 [Polistes canadensis]|uniref:uncharacterized protein LOC106790122 n=1 Tax=Polistes canadensis TaxID=91411 RepID=UPI000718B1E7|nr:PREDICTED: uncharacterized protein LOC106790122 [Polistes canadensis]